jgi:hypothetical protein
MYDDLMMFHCQRLVLIEEPEHDFVERFATAWQRPTPESLGDLLDDYIVLKQPHLPTICGKAAALAEFRRLLHWLPDFHGIVERATYAHNIVMIEWRMIFPIGVQPLTICAVDRLTLQNGLATERAVYFDTRPLRQAVMQHPRIWWGYLQYRYGRS